MPPRNIRFESSQKTHHNPGKKIIENILVLITHAYLKIQEEPI